MENDRYIEIRYEELVKSPQDCMEKITEFCELTSYNFLYRKDDIIINKKGKQKDSWEFMRMETVTNRNKYYENDFEIKKFTLTLRQELGY